MYILPTYRQQEGRKRAEGLVFGAGLCGLAAAFSWIVFAVVFARSVEPRAVGPGMSDALLLALAVSLSITTAVFSVCAFVQDLHNEQMTELERMTDESPQRRAGPPGAQQSDQSDQAR